MSVLPRPSWPFYRADPGPAVAGPLGGPIATAAVTAGLFAVLLGTIQLVAPALPPLVPGPGGEVAFSAHYAGLVLGVGFGVPLLALLAWRRWIERRTLGSLVTAAPRFRIGLMLTSALIMAAITTAGLLLLGEDQGPTRLADFSPLLLLGLIAALGLGFALQALCEEVWIRGWLVQRLCGHGVGLAGAMAISILVFAGLHWRPTEPASSLAGIAVMGVFLTLAAWRSGGLEASWGAHLGSNLTVAVVGGVLVAPQEAPGLMMAIGGALVQGLGLLGVVEVFARLAGRPPG